MGELPSCWLPYLTVVPHGKAGTRLITSFYYHIHRQWSLRTYWWAATVSTCLKYSLYNMTTFVNRDDDTVGVCNWFLWQSAHQVLPSLTRTMLAQISKQVSPLIKDQFSPPTFEKRDRGSISASLHILDILNSKMDKERKVCLGSKGEVGREQNRLHRLRG